MAAVHPGGAEGAGGFEGSVVLSQRDAEPF